MKSLQVLFMSTQHYSLPIATVLVGFELGLQVAAPDASLVFDLFGVIVSLSAAVVSGKVGADYFKVASSYNT